MLVLGLVLILAAAAVGAGAVFDGSEAASVELLGTTVDTTVAGVFFSGAATMLVLLLGVWLLTSSMGRARRKRAERKAVKRRQHESVQALEDERAQLRAENERLAGELGGRGTAEDQSTESARSADPARSADAGDTRVDHRTADGAPVAGDTTRSGAPLRESDGPASQGTHAASTEADLRQHETTTTRGDRA